MNKASSLSFISNAMVLHNTEQMQKVYEILDAKGHKIAKEKKIWQECYHCPLKTYWFTAHILLNNK